MKTPIKTLAVALLSLAFVSTGFTDEDHKGMKDHLMFKDGKVTMVMGGQSMAADKEIALTNGAKVALDGTITMKDGKTMKMKEGDVMGMDGTPMKHEPKKP
jgi:ribosomal protein S4E